jgi:hypothetical protein
VLLTSAESSTRAGGLSPVGEQDAGKVDVSQGDLPNACHLEASRA